MRSMTKAPWGGRRFGAALLAGAALVGACRDGNAAKVSRTSVPEVSSPDRLCPKLAETFYSRNELLVFFEPGSSASAVVAVTHRLEQSPLVAAVSRLGGPATRTAFRELFANQPAVLGSVDAERLPGAVIAAIPPVARSRQLDLLDELAGADGVLQLVPASIRGQAIATVLLFPWRLPAPVDWSALQEAFTLRGVTTSRARAAWGAVLGELASLDVGVAEPLGALVAAHRLLLTGLDTSRHGSLVGEGGLFSQAEWDRLNGDAARIAAAATGTCGIRLSG
jgi:hypothetical protein